MWVVLFGVVASVVLLTPGILIVRLQIRRARQILRRAEHEAEIVEPPWTRYVPPLALHALPYAVLVIAYLHVRGSSEAGILGAAAGAMVIMQFGVIAIAGLGRRVVVVGVTAIFVAVEIAIVVLLASVAGDGGVEPIDVTGHYRIDHGTNPNGGHYSGDVTISALPSEPGYRVEWTIGDGTRYQGVGEIVGTELIIGYGGTTPGVAYYDADTAAGDASLYRPIGGAGLIPSHVATGFHRSNDGTFDISIAGQRRGSVAIFSAGYGTDVTWTIDGATIQGAGLSWSGIVAVAWTSDGVPGVGDYAIHDGKLEGWWVTRGNGGRGHEVLVREPR